MLRARAPRLRNTRMVPTRQNLVSIVTAFAGIVFIPDEKMDKAE